MPVPSKRPHYETLWDEIRQDTGYGDRELARVLLADDLGEVEIAYMLGIDVVEYRQLVAEAIAERGLGDVVG